MRPRRLWGFVLVAVLFAGTPAGASEGVDSPGRPWSVFSGFTSHSFAHPGLHLGAEHALAATPRFRSLASVSLQVYHREDTETGYALHVRWGQRYTTIFGLTLESFLGCGAQLTHYQTTVFEFHESVAVAIVDRELRLGFTPHVAFGPGYDFESLLRVPLHLYARAGVALLYPDLNLAFQATLFAELGLRWTPRFR